MNKQNLWFLTLLTLILVLGIYYITIPTDFLEKIEESTEKNQPVVEEITEEDALYAMRANLSLERQETMDVLQEQLTSEKLTAQEKNNVYEELKYLNEVQGKEEQLEKKIKKEYDMDCFIKIENNKASAVCVSNEHDTTLANNIMRLIQKNYENKMDIVVKFQKK